jgi:hypothetical protein
MPLNMDTIDSAAESLDNFTTVDAVLATTAWVFLSLYFAMPFAVAGVHYWWSWSMVNIIGFAVAIMLAIGRTA